MNNRGIALTYFPELRSARGQRYLTSWAALGRRLARPQVSADKHDVPGISLATFRNDYRKLEHVEQVFAVGLDLDHDLPAWDVLAKGFESVSCILHTTWSSTAAEPRARVFLRLSRPVTAAEYRRVYAFCAGVVEREGVEVDRAASDPSRFWFLPSVKPDGHFLFAEGKGAPVNVEGALAAVPPAPPAPPPPPPRTPPSDAEERAARYLDRCDPAIEGSGGDNHTFLIAQRIVRGFCLSEETAYRLMCSWNARCEPPWSEHGLRRKIRQAATAGTMPYGALLDATRAAR